MKGVRLQATVYSLIFFFLLPVACGLWPVSAHLVGQPPFFKVNGLYSQLYPVPVTSLNNFDLPQDSAPDNYLVNVPISFEFDEARLPAPKDIIEKTKFDWDFTDGSHGEGLKQTHTFTKIGSYIIKIYADDGTTPKPQLLESVLVNVLPDKNYHLPQAKILINGLSGKDPLTDVLQFSFNQPLQMDGTKSTSSSGIAEYFWDLGDQKSALGATQTHLEPKDLSQAFIVLRVKDKNGLIADQFVEVQNGLNEQNSKQTPSTISPTPVPLPKKSNQLPLTLAAIVGLIIVLFMARHWLRGRYHGKRQ